MVGQRKVLIRGLFYGLHLLSGAERGRLSVGDERDETGKETEKERKALACAGVLYKTGLVMSF